MTTCKKRKVRCTDAEVTLARQLRAEGFSVGIIAVKFEVTERTVWRWITKRKRKRKSWRRC